MKKCLDGEYCTREDEDCVLCERECSGLMLQKHLCPNVPFHECDKFMPDPEYCEECFENGWYL